MLILPCIIILSIYSFISNFILIKKEGFNFKNLLGIFLGFLALLGLFGTQTIDFIISNLLVDKLIIKTMIDLSINITLSYFYTLIIATLYCNIKASRHIPKMDKDFVIILGCKIKDDGSLSPLLKNRVDKAIHFSKKQYDTLINKYIM